MLFVVSGFFLWLGERDHRFLFDGTGTVHETLTLVSVGAARRAPLSRRDPPVDAARAAWDDDGDVREDWAREHHPKWVEAERGL